MSAEGRGGGPAGRGGTPGAGDTVWAIIPARYQSTRFPGKPLASLAGKPMVQHVHERALATPGVARVMVATDDERIAAAVRGFGGEAIMTAPDQPSGTDRIAQALQIATGTGPGPTWVLNLQGDEPLVHPQDLARLVRGMAATPQGVLGTLVYPLADEKELHDPNVVKAVLDQQGRALFFSRSPLPYPRAAGALGWRHMGVYLFAAPFLHRFAALPPTPLAMREQLEQLRALEHGHTIHCFQASSRSVGVDVPADLARAAALLAT